MKIYTSHKHKHDRLEVALTCYLAARHIQHHVTITDDVDELMEIKVQSNLKLTNVFCNLYLYCFQLEIVDNEGEANMYMTIRMYSMH